MATRQSGSRGSSRGSLPAPVTPPPAEAAAHGDLRVVPLDAIAVPPRRMRRDLGDLDALAMSLHLHGQLAPVVVHAVGNQYWLVAGERRLEAARRLHAAEVKAGRVPADEPPTLTVLVRTELQPDAAREIELAENTQRRELSDQEEGDAFIRMVREDGREMREVAAISGRSVPYVSKRVRMFEDPALRAALVDRTISPAQAEELLILPEAERPDLLRAALTSGWGSKEIRVAVQARQRAMPVYDKADEYDGEEAPDTTEHHARPGFRSEIENRETLIERPRDLTRRIEELNAILLDLRPFQLKRGDDRALRRLWSTLRALAQAPREPTPRVFPSVAEAEALSRHR